MSRDRAAALQGVRLQSYHELEDMVQAFARGHLRLLIVLGGPGLGKSRIVRQALAGRACWLEGNLSVFGLYCQLWQQRHRPVVLDDVDGLYAQRDGVRLLKCLTQSERLKCVSWHTDAPTLRRQRIPQEFRTSSRVAIIANEWQTLNRNVAALQDRGHVVVFEPSALEVHRQAATWFWDQEIFDFVQARLHWIAAASLRHYLAAWELKQAGLDWRGLLLSRYLSGRALLVARLKADPQYTSEAQRVQAFLAAGGGSRATYFNWARKLHFQESAPPIRLRNAPPPPVTAGRDPVNIWRRRPAQ
jgi:hypothetical protein